MRAFGCKMWWKLRSGSSLWARFMLAKYAPGTRHIIEAPLRPTSSRIWRRLVACRDLMELLLREGTASFYFDNWLETGPITEGKGPIPLPNVKVGDLFDGTTWHLVQVREALTGDEQTRILGSQIQLSEGRDTWVWTPTTDGRFGVHSALKMLRTPSNNLISRKLIWDRRIPLKVSVFMWRLLNGWLPFPDKLQQFGLHLPSKCSFCLNSETLQHCFVHCRTAKQVWDHFECALGLRSVADSLLEKLQGWWIHASGTSLRAVLSHLLPILICWELWKARNQAIFNSITVRLTHICRQVVCLLSGIREAHPLALPNSENDAWSRLGLLPSPVRPPPLKWISLVWSLPSFPYSKLNVDGSSLGNPGHSGGGGIVRDHHGQVQGIFSTYYGYCTNMEAETRALLEGLQFCLSLGLVRVIVHMDAEQLLKVVLRGASTP